MASHGAGVNAWNAASSVGNGTENDCYEEEESLRGCLYAFLTNSMGIRCVKMDPFTSSIVVFHLFNRRLA